MNDLTPEQAEERRALMRQAWDEQASGWARQADRFRRDRMSLSARMVELAELQPGQRVLELAAGPGDTGFLAAEVVAPGGVLISSDGSQSMVEVARARAEELGVQNAEFKQIELEWIDLPTADVDAVLCRWGLMLALDPAAAVAECRRVLKPGGRLVAAVWGERSRNPDMVLPGKAMVSLGMISPPADDGPGPFALSGPGVLEELLRDGGFVDPVIEDVEIQLEYASVRDWLAEKVDLSQNFARVWKELDGEARGQLIARAAELASEFTAADGSLSMPGSSLVVVAEA